MGLGSPSVRIWLGYHLPSMQNSHRGSYVALAVDAYLVCLSLPHTPLQGRVTVWLRQILTLLCWVFVFVFIPCQAVVPVAHLDAPSVPKDVSAKDNLPPNAAAANNVCNFPS
ncbi:collagen alpha-2(VI) chain [Platysternon megacephalum]|uniref:Collagen alpha-2(VI) chain n=1 Tax=Platysternon megacephalum TaxID=55544 RepID=A0A4D9DRE5_9SAUR|nr:collagen alpha-2(VI) chain [Platysternon megacephalum]